MDPVTMAAVGAGTQLGSTLMQGMFSARQAKSQMRFQRDMYKQRYQFQVEDLKKAGLNPMLAYQQAAPAAPAGAMGQMDAPDMVSSARAAMLMKSERDKIKQDERTSKEQENLLYEQKVKTIHERRLLQMQREAYQTMKNNFGPMFGSYHSAQNMIEGGKAVSSAALSLLPWNKGIPFKKGN